MLATGSLMKRSRAPSGDQDNDWKRLLVPDMNVSVPPRRVVTTIECVSGLPDWIRMKAIFVPSGDQRGENFRPEEVSSIVWVEVFTFTVLTRVAVPAWSRQ